MRSFHVCDPLCPAACSDAHFHLKALFGSLLATVDATSEYYDVLLRETLNRQPDANLYVFVDDIAVRAPDTTTLPTTLDDLNHVAHRMGLGFNADKTEIYAWGRHCAPTAITWQGQRLDVRPPILTYLGHVLAHPSHEEHTWELVTTQLHHDLAAYKTLPLNGFEKVTIINSVLIPRWTYRGLFLGNRQRMANWDDILLEYLRSTPGIEQRMNRHRSTTDLRDGGLELRQIWWGFITR